VQVGTANFIRPDAAIQVVREIEAYLAAHGIATVRELTGALQPGVPK
jgi:dihydroorotate dehydrogenase